MTNSEKACPVRPKLGRVMGVEVYAYAHVRPYLRRGIKTQINSYAAEVRLEFASEPLCVIPTRPTVVDSHFHKQADLLPQIQSL